MARSRATRRIIAGSSHACSRGVVFLWFRRRQGGLYGRQRRVGQ
jgi:hypothetical protein